MRRTEPRPAYWRYLTLNRAVRMSRHAHTRRDFVGQLGMLSLAGLAAPGELAASEQARRPRREVPRGLASSPDDFALAPGLVYLQTGSMGPTPRPVMERTIAAWKQLELDPVAYGYGEQEH